MTRKRKPTVNDTFLERICYALDTTPLDLARSIQVPYKELKPLLDAKNTTVDVDMDDVWWRIGEHVNEKLSMVLAVKGELEKQLQKDRARRVARHARFKRTVK